MAKERKKVQQKKIIFKLNYRPENTKKCKKLF